MIETRLLRRIILSELGKSEPAMWAWIFLVVLIVTYDGGVLKVRTVYYTKMGLSHKPL